MAERIAVVGIGQTHHQSTRGDVSAGLVREAAQRALDDAQYDWSEIDAVVIGKAPDFFEGVMMPELYLAEALGSVGKPMFRVHTAGSVGGSTVIVASHLVESGIHAPVLAVRQGDIGAIGELRPEDAGVGHFSRLTGPRRLDHRGPGFGKAYACGGAIRRGRFVAKSFQEPTHSKTIQSRPEEHRNDKPLIHFPHQIGEDQIAPGLDVGQ